MVLHRSSVYTYYGALIFLEYKRCGKIKGCMCADGRKHQETWKKLDATSPTLATKSLLITTDIDASDNRDVKAVDTSGVLITADMYKEVILVPEGVLAEIMVVIFQSTYRDYVSVRKLERRSYMWVSRKRYTVVSALTSSSIASWRVSLGLLVSSPTHMMRAPLTSGLTVDKWQSHGMLTTSKYHTRTRTRWQNWF